MAAYSSSQNGNFNSSTTWGGNTPADGDTLTINHTVTITGTNQPTNGYGDILVGTGGVLTNADNAVLRMNGNIRVELGTVHFKDHLTIEWNGADGDNHGLQVDNSAGSHCIIEGDDPTAITTTSAATDGNECTHSFTSASNFAVGDWVQIYSHNYTSTSTENDGRRYDDEGFWIHDINGNTVYTRDFVGPEESTVTSVNGTKLFVSNAKVFREGMQIIFGTGSNRNIRTISSIAYKRNLLTLNSSVTGSVVGETVYRAMSLKPHPSGSKVRKMAYAVASEAASGSTTLTLNGVSGLSVGDRVWVEKRSEAGGASDYAYNNSGYDYEIQSISGNTLTFTTSLGYKVVVGSLVSLLSRSIKFKTLTSSDYAHFYVEHRSGYDRYIILKDIEFDGWGDSDSNLRTGVVLRGLNKVNDASIPVTLNNTIPQQHRGTWCEGITVTQTAGHNRDWGGIWLYDCRSAVARCCTALYGDDGISVYYEPYTAAMGNIIAGQDNFGIRCEGMSELTDISYMYVSRCNNRIRHFAYDSGIGGWIHNIIVDASDYAGLGWYRSHPGDIWRCKFTGMRYGVITEGVVELGGGMVDCYFKNLSGEQTLNADGYPTNSPQSGQFRQAHYNRGLSSSALMSIEHQHEVDRMHLFGYNWEAYWDEDEDAWHFLRRDENDNNPSMGETVYIPANATGRFTVKCKAVSGFSGNRPYAFAIDTRSSLGENILGFTASSNRPLRGKKYNTQFTTAFDSAYEEVQITISSEPFSRYYKIGVRSDNRNATEGFYIKEFDFFLDKGLKQRHYLMGNFGSVNPHASSGFRNSFTQQKKRLGGRLK